MNDNEQPLDLSEIEARWMFVPRKKLLLVTDEEEMDDSQYWVAEIRDEKGNTIADLTDNCRVYGEPFANAPTDITDLVQEVKRLRGEVTKLSKSIHDWGNDERGYEIKRFNPPYPEEEK